MTTTPTLTLADFLLRRIEEDEAVARAAANDHYMVDPPLRWGEVGGEVVPDLTIDPARVLAECAAKRAIVATVLDSSDESAAEPRAVLRALASVYSSHPDYRDEWRP